MIPVGNKMVVAVVKAVPKNQVETSPFVDSSGNTM